MSECTICPEKYKAALDLFTNLQNDIFEIVKVAYGEEIAYKLFESLMDEDCEKAKAEKERDEFLKRSAALQDVLSALHRLHDAVE